jgi:hypothetical protein
MQGIEVGGVVQAAGNALHVVIVHKIIQFEMAVYAVFGELTF